MISYSSLRPHPSSLLQPRSVRYVLGEGGEDGAALSADGGGEHHALRLEAAELARLEVGDDDYFAPDQFFRLVVFGDARENLSRLGLAEVNGEAQELVRLRHALCREHFADAHLDLREVVNRDEARDSLRRLRSASGRLPLSAGDGLGFGRALHRRLLRLRLVGGLRAPNGGLRRVRAGVRGRRR